MKRAKTIRVSRQAATHLTGSASLYQQMKRTGEALLLPTGAKLVFRWDEWTIFGYAADGSDVALYEKYALEYARAKP